MDKNYWKVMQLKSMGNFIKSKIVLYIERIMLVEHRLFILSISFVKLSNKTN